MPLRPLPSALCPAALSVSLPPFPPFRPFLRLDLLPAHQNLARRVEGRLALIPREDVRMAPHQLVGDLFQRVGNLETAGFGLELGQKHGLEDEVAELLARAS